jgi:hypothetical protein
MGERNAQARLTAPEVLEIRRRHAVGDITMASLGREYGVTAGQVNLIVKRKKWKHI